MTHETILTTPAIPHPICTSCIHIGDQAILPIKIILLFTIAEWTKSQMYMHTVPVMYTHDLSQGGSSLVQVHPSQKRLLVHRSDSFVTCIISYHTITSDAIAVVFWSTSPGDERDHTSIFQAPSCQSQSTLLQHRLLIRTPAHTR